VSDLPAIELAEQVDRLLEKGPDLLTFHFVFAVELPDKQLAVTKDGQPLGVNLFRGFERLYDAGIFSYIVRRSTDEEGLAF